MSIYVNQKISRNRLEQVWNSNSQGEGFQCGGSWHCDIESYTANIKDPIDSNAQKPWTKRILQWGREDEWIAPVPQSDWTSGSAKLDPCVLPTPSFRKFEWVGESGSPKVEWREASGCFKIFNISKCLKWFFFKWMFNSKNILRKKGG